MKAGKLNWMKSVVCFSRKILITQFCLCFIALKLSACGIVEPEFTDAISEGQSIVVEKKSTPASPNDPILPQAYLETKYIPSTKPAIRVKAGDDLQSALNNAKPGDTLMLEPGAKFVGNFILPRKTGDGFIVIRSAAPDSSLPPEGSRIGPQHAHLLPKILTPNEKSALKTAPRAHHYRFIGIEFSQVPNVEMTYSIVGAGDPEQSANEVPHDLIFDRVYIHGHPSTIVRRGFSLNSASTAIIDSYISDCHEPEKDSQAILGWNGPGPFKIVNNYLEGAGENIMFGGATASIPNLIPSDIEFRHNHCYKPVKWKEDDPSFAGRAWAVKNLFEIKNGQRILVEGNIFENNWAESQRGFAILFTVRDEDGEMPWAVCRDITFINNIVRHSASVFSIATGEGVPPEKVGGYTGRIKIENNLFDDIISEKWGKPDGSGGVFLKLVNGPSYIQVIHNTAVHNGKMADVDTERKAKGFVFTDNVVFNNEYGFWGNGVGIPTLETLFSSPVFNRNVIIGAKSKDYPKGNLVTEDKNVIGFVGKENNKYVSTEYAKINKSAPDVKRPGVDLNALNEALFGSGIKN